MTDHEHEWEYSYYLGRFICKHNPDVGCGGDLLIGKAEAILNEHAALKRVRDVAEELDELRPMTKGWLRIFASRITALQDALADTQKRKFVPTPEPESVPPDTLKEEVVCFECAENIANCECPSGFNLGDVCEEAKKKANLCACSTCRQWAKEVHLGDECIAQLEAELADYKAGIEGMHASIRDLRAELDALKEGDDALPDIQENK